YIQPWLLKARKISATRQYQQAARGHPQSQGLSLFLVKLVEGRTIQNNCVDRIIRGKIARQVSRTYNRGLGLERLPAPQRVPRAASLRAELAGRRNGRSRGLRHKGNPILQRKGVNAIQRSLVTVDHSNLNTVTERRGLFLDLYRYLKTDSVPRSRVLDQPD